jgi:hypothetical protein
MSKKPKMIRCKPVEEYQKEYLKKWRAEHPGYEAQRRRRKMERSPIQEALRTIYNNTFHRAKRKTIAFTLERQWVEERIKSGKCEATGINFVLEVASPYMPSIDRIDNDKGYTGENCRVVIWFLNRARNELSDPDFLNLLRKVVDGLAKMQGGTVRGRNKIPVRGKRG